MTTYSQLSTTEPKKKKLSKQLEQEQNHRNGDQVSDSQLTAWDLHLDGVLA